MAAFAVYSAYLDEPAPGSMCETREAAEERLVRMGEILRAQFPPTIAEDLAGALEVREVV